MTVWPFPTRKLHGRIQILNSLLEESGELNDLLNSSIIENNYFNLSFTYPINIIDLEKLEKSIEFSILTS